MSTGPTVPRPSPEPRPRLDRGLVAAVVTLLLSFPLMLVWLVLAGWLARITGAADDAGRLAAVNAVLVVLVVLPMAVSGVLGVRVWRRRRQRGGLVVAGAAVLSVLGVLLLPVLASL